MTLTDDAWLAGLFEGEGCLSRRRGGGWELTIAMNDEDVVRRAAAQAGVGTVTVRRSSKLGWSDQWAWRVGRRDEIRSVVDRIRPLLGERRGARADEFIAWQTSGCARDVSPEFLARAARQQREHRARKRMQKV